MLVILVVVLALAALFISMDNANINVIIQDGMKERANTVLYDHDIEPLSTYFTDNFIDKDPLLNEDPYNDYIISSFSYSLHIDTIWCWPWQNRVAVTATEIIRNINGDLSTEMLTKDPDQPRVPPEWDNAELRIILEREDGKWKIDEVTPLHMILDDGSATPWPAPTFTPVPTPTLAPTATPTPTLAPTTKPTTRRTTRPTTKATATPATTARQTPRPTEQVTPRPTITPSDEPPIRTIPSEE